MFQFVFNYKITKLPFADARGLAPNRPDVNARHVLVHRTKQTVAIRTDLVIGQLELAEDDLTLHPERAGIRRLGMKVDTVATRLGALRLLAGAARDPFARLELPGGLLGEREVDEDLVLAVGLQAAQLVLECGEHATALLRDYHLGCVRVELVPQLTVAQRQVDGAQVSWH